MSYEVEKTLKKNKWWAIIIGIGLALSPIHNQWLTQKTTTCGGETLFFLPSIGYLLLIMGSGMFIVWHWNEIIQVLKSESKKILLPLLAIVILIGLSGATATSFQDKIAPLCMAISMFALYLSTKVIGRQLFVPLAAGVAIASFGIIAYSSVYPGTVTGGFIFENNYDIVVGYIVLGLALTIPKYRWLLALIALLALLLSGSPEALFAIGILGAIIIVREKWTKQTAIAGSAIAVTAISLIFVNFQLYQYAGQIVKQEVLQGNFTPLDENEQRQSIGYRIWVIQEAMTNINPIGDGYSVTEFRTGIVHNVPLIIVQQLGYPGIVAALFWLWITIYCLVKTKHKYIWSAVITLSIFDHYIWTQLAPYWWAIIGLTTSEAIESDLILQKSEIAATTINNEVNHRMRRIIDVFKGNQ